MIAHVQLALDQQLTIASLVLILLKYQSMDIANVTQGMVTTSKVAPV